MVRLVGTNTAYDQLYYPDTVTRRLVLPGRLPHGVAGQEPLHAQRGRPYDASPAEHHAPGGRAGDESAWRNTRIGVVSGYDPANYAAKVRIQPEDVETGWLPVATPWSGPGWGMFCPPSLDDVVDVHFQEGGKEAGFVCLRHFGDRFRPLPVPSGEFWLVHKSGSNFKFHDGGIGPVPRGDGHHLQRPDLEPHRPIHRGRLHPGHQRHLR